jgi:hypothetical protein
MPSVGVNSDYGTGAIQVQYLPTNDAGDGVDWALQASHLAQLGGDDLRDTTSMSSTSYSPSVGASVGSEQLQQLLTDPKLCATRERTLGARSSVYSGIALQKSVPYGDAGQTHKSRYRRGAIPPAVKAE